MNEIQRVEGRGRVPGREILTGVVVSERPTNPALVKPGQGRISTDDLLAMLLRDKRSLATQDAYRSDLRHHYLTFREGTARFAKATRCEPLEVVEYLDTFLGWPRSDIAFRLNEYKALMIEGKYAEATIARRLSATKAMLGLAYRFGRCETDGRGLVDIEKVRAYRETHGISVAQVRDLLSLPQTVHGLGSVAALRDEAMIRLMAQSGLRRDEVLKITVGDFSLRDKYVYVLGKGRGLQKEIVKISESAAGAIGRYLEATGRLVLATTPIERAEPIFRNLDHRPAHAGNPLTKRALNKIVGEYGTRLGIHLKPHQLRHTFGTQLSLKTGGDVPAVQRAMRHADANTTMRYIENAKDLQGRMVDLLTDVYD